MFTSPSAERSPSLNSFEDVPGPAFPFVQAILVAAQHRDARSLVWVVVFAALAFFSLPVSSEGFSFSIPATLSEDFLSLPGLRDLTAMFLYKLQCFLPVSFAESV